MVKLHAQLIAQNTEVLSRLRSTAISVSQALLSTARLEEGSKVRIHSLSSKVPQWLPPLHRSQEARTIHLREISNDSSRLADKVADAAKGKDRDWLPLLLRETLGTPGSTCPAALNAEGMDDAQST